MDVPFNGAISRYFEQDAPQEVRDAIEKAGKSDMLEDDYPYRERLAKHDYNKTMEALQIELVKMQSHVKANGKRVAVIFEGRDAAGKGGTIKRFREHLNPRGARVVALSKPSDKEASQWYFQRYVEHLPSGGEIVFFDRSWYNRGVVEHVFGFCTPQERNQFFFTVPGFEEMIVNEGIQLVKLWMNVGRAEQLRRFLSREQDPLKHWKLSPIDVKGLGLWDEYSKAIQETFDRSHSLHAPWTVVRTDDKKRARIASIQQVLSQIDYPDKNHKVVHAPDPLICGGPEIWDA